MAEQNLHELIVEVMQDFTASVEGGADFYDLEENLVVGSQKLQSAGLEKKDADLRMTGQLLARLDLDDVLKQNSRGVVTPFETDLETVKGLLGDKFGSKASLETTRQLAQGYTEFMQRKAPKFPNIPVTKPL